jgi:glycosidase
LQPVESVFETDSFPIFSRFATHILGGLADPLSNPERAYMNSAWPWLVAALAALGLLLWARHALALTSEPEQPALRLIPISEGLGLFDVELDRSLDDREPLAVSWRTSPGGPFTPAGHLLPAPRYGPPGDADATSRLWRARLRITPAPGAAPGVEVRVESPRAARVWTAKLASLDPGEAFRTPDWAKGVVWYQVFPERFRNGNPGNDPSGARDQRVFKMPWTAPWFTVSEAELEAARNRHIALPRHQGPLHAREVGGQLYNVVFQRRYGGDLQGVVEKIDELHDLGIDALYLTPVFRAQSLHKYDAADYRHIDDSLGDPTVEPPNRWHEPGETLDPATWTWTRADRYVLDVLIPEVRKRGMRIIFDGVWNHTGLEHFAFQDVYQNGQRSTFADWYNARFVPDPKPTPVSDDDGLHQLGPGDLMSWKGWGGRANGGLPVFSQTTDRNLVEPVKRHIFDVTRRWMNPRPEDPLAGIDGWRLDVASEIGLPFWREWRKHVKAINPDALLIAEIWHPARAYFEGNGFDGQMNYPLARAILGWLGQRPGMTSEQFARELEQQVTVNHPATDLVQMNVLDSHDTDRLASMLMNPGRAYDAGGLREDPAYVSGRPGPEIVDLVIVAIALQTACPGAPMVYYGTEYGMWGPDDPDNRKPLPWPDLGPMTDPADAPVAGMRERVAAWLRLRRHPTIGPALKWGATRYPPSGSPDVFIIQRQLNSTLVTIIANRGGNPFNAADLVGTAQRLEMGEGGDGVVGARGAGVWVEDVR